MTKKVNPWISQKIVYLEEIYNALNVKFFNGELRKAAMTINMSSTASSPKSFDNLSADGKSKVFTIELNLGCISQPIEMVVADIVHEMVHEYNNSHPIYNNKGEVVHDVSRGGFYHNDLFKKTAEAHGLLVDTDSDGKYGWCETYPSKKLRDFVRQQGWENIEIANTSLRRGEPAKNSSHKWICPKCKLIIRATIQGDIDTTHNKCGVKYIRCD